MNIIKKSALALIAAVALSANTSQADEGAQATHPFENLVKDNEALQAWWNGTNSLNKPQPVVAFNGQGLGEVAQHIVTIFSNQFDLVMPDDPNPDTINVKLELKNVNAIEIFNAMNMYFETGKIQAHWKLTLNGSRPTAILEMTEPKVIPPTALTERKPTVFSIADILYAPGDDQTNIDARADWILNAVAEVLSDIKKPDSPGGSSSGPEFKIHKETGLLVFTGTTQETSLVFSTLGDLQQTLIRKASAVRDAAEALKRKEAGNLKK